MFGPLQCELLDKSAKTAFYFRHFSNMCAQLKRKNFDLMFLAQNSIKMQ